MEDQETLSTFVFTVQVQVTSSYHNMVDGMFIASLGLADYNFKV